MEDELKQQIETILKGTLIERTVGLNLHPNDIPELTDDLLHFITTYGIEAQQQGAVNAITQFKVARINHTMSRPVQEWETEFDTATKTLVDYIAELTKLKGEK